MHRNEARVITGQPSMDPWVEGSGSTDSTEESETRFPQLHIQEVRETVPLPLHNVTVDVSLAEEDCGDEATATPRLPSRDHGHSSPVSNKTASLSSSPPYERSTDSQDRLTVQTASSPDDSRRFSLSRSSTFSFGENGESFLSSSLSPLDNGSQTWPRIWDLNIGLNSSMKSPDILADIRAEDNPVPEQVLDNANSAQPLNGEISQQNDSKVRNAQRPYTSLLGIPDDVEFGGPSDPSVISDAGDQQHKRQKLANRKDRSRESSIIQGEPKTREQIDPVASRASKYKLQKDLFDALVTPRTTHVHIPQKGFLPKAQLDRLVNKDSVLRELTMELGHLLPPRDIKRMAGDVYRETEVDHGHKKKIKSFRKIFALLVLTETTQSIGFFLDEDVSDLDLPLVDITDKEDIGDIGSNGHMGDIGYAEDNEDTEDNEGAKDSGLRRRDSFGNPCAEPLKCFEHYIWSPMKLDNFKRNQWIMLAPFFSQGDDGEVKHYSLRPQHILPFIAPKKGKEDDIGYSGGYGRVFMVRIHQEHHNFGDAVLCKRGFAIKQLHEEKREPFNREVKILKTFSGERSHLHIVSLLATYEHLNKFHFIFYRAEGDLSKYWERSPSFEYKSIVWMAEQSAGLADGLFKLHKHLTFRRVSRAGTEVEDTKRQTSVERRVRIAEPAVQREREIPRQSSDKVWPSSPTSLRSARRSTGEHPGKSIQKTFSDVEEVVQYGRHGDINPRNILWYDSSEGDSTCLKGTLKIADFGQAEFNSQFSRSRQRDVANTMTYRPPECDLQPKIISQSYDIWCLGCVFLEFVAWMLGGNKLVNDFARKRKAMDHFIGVPTDTFYQIEGKPSAGQAQVKIKDAVTKFIYDLHQHRNCTEYFHEFLNLIENSMLVVEAKHRATCEEIRKALEAKSQRCRIDNDYTAQKNPWCYSKLSPSRFTEPVEVPMTEDAERALVTKLPSLPERPIRGANNARRCSYGRAC